MYSLPQEIEVWYIIPAIRRELAKTLTEKYGLTQERTARILGVSESAISQYMHSMRATNVKFTTELAKEIEKSAEKIAKNDKVVVKEIMYLLSLVKKKGIRCECCQKYNKGILEICSMKPSME